MVRLTDDELIRLIEFHDPRLAEITRRVIDGKDQHCKSLVDDVRRVLPRIGRKGITPDVQAALDRLRAAVRDSAPEDS